MLPVSEAVPTNAFGVTLVSVKEMVPVGFIGAKAVTVPVRA